MSDGPVSCQNMEMAMHRNDSQFELAYVAKVVMTAMLRWPTTVACVHKKVAMSYMYD